MAQQPTLTPIWHLAQVRQLTEQLHHPLGGHGEFSIGQQVFFWPMGDGGWMVFDGMWLYSLLETEEAKAALTSCRDEAGQVLLDSHQDLLTERFSAAVSAQGTGFTCRLRDGGVWQEGLTPPDQPAAGGPALDERRSPRKRKWYCCQVKDAEALQSRINGTHFRTGQHAYCSQQDETTWLLFDGHRYACVLTPDLAKQALATRRDSQNQRVRAPAATEERFLKSVYGQTGRRTRKERRFW